MTTAKLLSDVILPAANVLGGTLLAVLALMAAFAALGQIILVVQRVRAARAKGAPGHAPARRPAASGAAAVAD